MAASNVLNIRWNTAEPLIILNITLNIAVKMLITLFYNDTTDNVDEGYDGERILMIHYFPHLKGLCNSQYSGAVYEHIVLDIPAVIALLWVASDEVFQQISETVHNKTTIKLKKNIVYYVKNTGATFKIMHFYCSAFTDIEMFERNKNN